jgi:hypothetical protein
MMETMTAAASFKGEVRTDQSLLDRVKADIELLDLDTVKYKLMDPIEGEGWEEEKIEKHVREYRDYLFIAFKYPGAEIAPTKGCDIVWHHHILDTVKYVLDTDRIFGYYLHHFPFLGLRSATDAENLKKAGELAHALLHSHEMSDSNHDPA